MKMNRNMDFSIEIGALLPCSYLSDTGRENHNMWIPTIAGSECKIFFSLDSHIGVVERWPNEVVNVRYVTASSLNVDKNKHRNPSFLLDPPNLCSE